MTSKHTPGPWVATPHPDQNVNVFAVGEITDEAFQYGLSHTVCYQNAEANARLIAAAPELLQACQAARALTPDGTHTAGVLDAAIAKAMGGAR